MWYRVGHNTSKQSLTKSDNLSKILCEPACAHPCIGSALSHLINVAELERRWSPATLVVDKEEKLIKQVSRMVAILLFYWPSQPTYNLDENVVEQAEIVGIEYEYMTRSCWSRWLTRCNLCWVNSLQMGWTRGCWGRSAVAAWCNENKEEEKQVARGSAFDDSVCDVQAVRHAHQHKSIPGGWPMKKPWQTWLMWRW